MDERREQILEAIRRLTAENEGRSPGTKLFTTRTGIGPSEWYGRYWARWSDALCEAGVEKNERNSKIDEGELLRKIADAVDELGHFPTYGELRIYARNNSGFPSHTTLTNHFRGRNLRMLYAEWCKANDRAALSVHSETPDAPVWDQSARQPKEGWVYLLKSGRHYKIGRSDELERRLKQISIALPEKAELVHAIRTDDPVGIEEYWHKRFAPQRANGEWFELSLSDVRAFRRRTFQ